MTKIIATIGPSTENEIKKLCDLGVNIFRLNLSHNSIEWHINVINNIREITPSSSILVDIPGRKIRTTSKVCKDKFKEGQIIYLVSNKFDKYPLESRFIYEINNNRLFDIAKRGMEIYADDGRLKFIIKEVCNEYITLITKCDGLLKECKGINIPGSYFDEKNLNDQDKFFLDFCCQHKVDFIGISFVDNSDYLNNIKTYIGDRRPKAIAKIENATAIHNLSEILKISFAIMIDRGDLSVETNTSSIGILQKDILFEANKLGVPVIVATEMLHTMQKSINPTKAECNDITNSVLDGASCLMLSGETAVGKYPYESIETMRSIIDLTMKYILDRNKNPLEYIDNNELSQADLMARSVSLIASSNISKGLVCISKTGEGVRFLARYINKDFYCITDSYEIIRDLNIFRNVQPILSDVVFKKNDRFHIYSIAKQLIDNGWNPDLLYTFIYVSEGGAGLRLNTIQINYLKSLAGFIV
ncbi:pyruvate kinase [Prochlorococcus marinus]|uniref:pyruvate kinase n=1 Tax=Prochlorococcus marinus TaxID=1219 RepID=UPI0022B4757D|nr:pyruvate kinase [Prochlorococcus marinus]